MKQKAIKEHFVCFRLNDSDYITLLQISRRFGNSLSGTLRFLINKYHREEM